MSIEALGYYLGLGFFHGLNPAMGWLFAVALALQHNSSRWIGRAVIALGVGHFLSVFCLCTVFILLGKALPQLWVKGLCVSALFGFGGYWLFRARHPRWVGMNVGLAELVGWSFLMASAHGAGLMLVAGSSLCGKSFLPLPVQWDSLKLFFYPSVIHSIGYFFTVSILATLVFRADLLGLLYRKWINFDILWAISLFLAGIGTILA
ncbi:hypothetical protein EM20IM_08100 [Candidatus Methylacidiphilum infernorum]|uniref:Lysine transporter LysE n=1 Tax=Candidatus Methylacidiphilum infernorum TaxID=511746 RepID=A0ABX7PU20_9BACT|nr:hypothetical protein [Candidatus Methylacidiphilum infernorum]QSR86447.1 hypothetical protein EM20IM_08100 [Candidatus Methylacidiphilum infernorum]